jgi:hypothetical protein
MLLGETRHALSEEMVTVSNRGDTIAHAQRCFHEPE